MSEIESRQASEPIRQTRNGGETAVRAVGSPLPMGGSPRTTIQGDPEDAHPSHPAPPPPGRALTGATTPRPPASGFQKAVGALKLAMPFMQKIIPLLDGNVATTVSNLLSPPAAPSASPAHLTRIEGGMAELESAHRELREQVSEQNNSLRRVEDQLEMVREATDRNTLEQQELMEDLKTVGNRVNILALVLLGLLAVSLLLNLVLFLHIRRVLP